MKEAGQLIDQLLGGKYRVQQLLALGGMGFVYAARHEVTGRAVALKLLRPELAGRPDLVERVSLEARLAVEASHPNVVEVLDAGADDQGVPYLVLERLYGQPLEALLEAPLSLRCTLEALVPVINALVTLHGAGIVHRDIKPSNIFLSHDENGRVTPKLLDFGIAKALESSGATLTGVTLGTPAYMAPEQLLCSTAAGPASDVWSMAVVGVRCLTGRWPFAEVATRGLGSLRAGLHPAELDGVPEPVARVLSAALRPDPSERLAHALELRKQLFAALAELAEARPWPDETRVSFAEPDSELARTLTASLARATSAGLTHARTSARPGHVVTRTLSRVWQSMSLPRDSAAGPLGVLATVVVLGLVMLATLTAPTHTRTPELEPTPGPHGVPAATEGRGGPLHWPERADLDVSPPNLARPSLSAPRAAEPAPSTGAVKARAARPRPETTSRNPTPALAAPASEPDTTSPPASTSAVVGANRSPIID